MGDNKLKEQQWAKSGDDATEANYIIPLISPQGHAHTNKHKLAKYVE